MNTDPITNSELEAYLSGKLSSKEQHAIELKMASSDIYDDAVDGYKSTGAGLAGFAALQQRFETNLGASSSSSAGAASSSAASFGQIIGICFGISLITVLGLSVANERQKTEQSSPVNIVQNFNPIVAKNNAPVISEMTEQEVLQEIELELTDIQPMDEGHTISYQKTVANQADNAPKRINDIEEQGKESVELDLVKIDDPKELVEDVHAPQSNMRTVFLHDLKVVDVSSFYTKKIKIRNMNDVSGTRVYSAEKYMSKDNPIGDNLGPYIYVDYMTYLNDAMALFSKDSYKQALKNFKVIISHYPNDVNAHFYGALCYHNLGKPSRAIQYLNMVIADQINTFNPEAQFYKAISYAEAGKKDEAKKLFKTIEDEKGFYAKRARSERLSL